MGLSFQKNYIDGTKAIILNHIFEEKFKKEDWYTDNLPERIFNNGGSLKGLRGIPDEVRKVFVVAHDIGYKERIDMQSEIQKYTSNGISSTINLPRDATIDDISYIYKYAYEKNLKGVTIYRDGSKRNQPVTFTEEVKEEKFVRPNKLLGNVYKVETGNGRMYVTIGEYHGKPVEVFIQIGKSGQIMNTFSEALGRIISLALQNGVPVDEVTEKLSGINSDKSVWFRFDEADKKPSQILSAPDGLAQLLNRYYSGKQYEQELTGEICEKCGSNMTMVEGCVTCNNCGNSKCS
jgi:ribonucleoside-diphosphate reductase alpha chain